MSPIEQTVMFNSTAIFYMMPPVISSSSLLLSSLELSDAKVYELEFEPD
jgi:hypothetical protein